MGSVNFALVHAETHRAKNDRDAGKPYTTISTTTGSSRSGDGRKALCSSQSKVLHFQPINLCFFVLFFYFLLIYQIGICILGIVLSTGANHQVKTHPFTPSLSLWYPISQFYKFIYFPVELLTRKWFTVIIYMPRLLYRNEIIKGNYSSLVLINEEVNWLICCTIIRKTRNRFLK